MPSPKEDGGRDLSGRFRTPHILIEGDAQLTARLWWGGVQGPSRLPPGQRPTVLTPNFKRSELARQLENNGQRFVRRVDLLGLFHEMDNGGLTPGSRSALRANLEQARRDFGLKRADTLNVLMVGCHSTLTNQIRTGLIQDGAAKDQLEDYFKSLRECRKMALRLKLLFEQFNRVEAVWLTNAYRQLRPGKELEGDLDGLARHERAQQARRMLASVPQSATQAAPTLPTIPVIYTRIAEPPGWRRFEGIPGVRAAYRTTANLISQFAASEERRSGSEAVLVKILVDNVSPYNPLDPPMITTEHLDKALEAGISAVLLDSRYGIVSRKEIKSKTRPARPAAFEPDPLPVFRA